MCIYVYMYMYIRLYIRIYIYIYIFAMLQRSVFSISWRAVWCLKRRGEKKEFPVLTKLCFECEDIKSLHPKSGVLLFKTHNLFPGWSNLNLSESGWWLSHPQKSTIIMQDLNHYIETKVCSVSIAIPSHPHCIWKWGIPKSAWISILKLMVIHDLDDRFWIHLGVPPWFWTPPNSQFQRIQNGPPFFPHLRVHPDAAVIPDDPRRLGRQPLPLKIPNRLNIVSSIYPWQHLAETL